MNSEQPNRPEYFTRTQIEFANYIKDPNNSPLPDNVSERRMVLYRELFFNNINSFLSGNFPVLKTLLELQNWNDLIQGFILNHTSQSPYFSEIPEEFLSYLHSERDMHSEDPPFLQELAHYEWVEMALSIDTNPAPKTNHDLLANPLEQQLILSPLAWPLIYQYPVHKISLQFLPVQAPSKPTCLVVYRNRQDEVKFIEITAETFRLLQIIQDSPNILVKTCLEQLTQELCKSKPEIFIAGALKIIKEMSDIDIILNC